MSSRAASYSRMILVGATLAISAQGLPRVAAAEISGVPHVVDGDTLVLGDTKIRLLGIDAPETDQVCLDAAGQRWRCGITARDQLSVKIAGQPVTCTTAQID